MLLFLGLSCLYFFFLLPFEFPSSTLFVRSSTHWNLRKCHEWGVLESHCSLLIYGFIPRLLLSSFLMYQEMFFHLFFLECCPIVKWVAFCCTRKCVSTYFSFRLPTYRAVTSTRTAFIVGHHVINERSVRLLEPSGYWWLHDTNTFYLRPRLYI